MVENRHEGKTVPQHLACPYRAAEHDWNRGAQIHLLSAEQLVDKGPIPRQLGEFLRHGSAKCQALGCFAAGSSKSARKLASSSESGGLSPSRPAAGSAAGSASSSGAVAEAADDSGL